jgi:tripartite-type tricarboxylate transporter receptor subunit TctC
MAKKLEAAALTAIKSAAVQEHMRKGEISGTLNAKEFAARIANDAARWRPMLPKLGITAQEGPAPAAAPAR